MYRLASDHGKHNRRNIASDLVTEAVKILTKNGAHFVISDIKVRGKEGALADSAKPERGGELGLNWSVQNTGAIAALVQQLEQKAKESGGSVRKFAPTSPLPQKSAQGHHSDKILMAERLRADFLVAYEAGSVE